MITKLTEELVNNQHTKELIKQAKEELGFKDNVQFGDVTVPFEEAYTKYANAVIPSDHYAKFALVIDGVMEGWCVASSQLEFPSGLVVLSVETMFINKAHRTLANVNAFYDALRECTGTHEEINIGIMTNARGHKSAKRYGFEEVQRIYKIAPLGDKVSG